MISELIINFKLFHYIVSPKWQPFVICNLLKFYELLLTLSFRKFHEFNFMFTAVRLQICYIAICHFNFLGRAMPRQPTDRSCSGLPTCHFWHNMSCHAPASFFAVSFATCRSLFRKLECQPYHRFGWIYPTRSCPTTFSIVSVLHLQYP